MIATKKAPQIGKIIPLATLAEMNDEAQARALERNPNRQFRKKEGFNDKAHVITIEKLHQILREELADGKVARTAAQVCMRAVVTFLQRGVSEFSDDAGQAYDSALEDVGNRILNKARLSVLRQDSVRHRINYRYAKRAFNPRP